METLSRNGAQFRSKTMEDAKAIRFANCLKANPRFVGVAVCPSPKKSGHSYVTFNPASDPNGEAILLRQQDARAERAMTEGADYIFAADDSGRFVWCMNPKSGETYEVTSVDCTCPDHHYRCRPAGIQCKHIIALVNGAAPVRSFVPVVSVAAKRAEIDALWA